MRQQNKEVFGKSSPPNLYGSEEECHQWRGIRWASWGWGGSYWEQVFPEAVKDSSRYTAVCPADEPHRDPVLPAKILQTGTREQRALFTRFWSENHF